MFKKIVAGLATLSAIATGVYLLLIRPWHLRWGATDEEVRQPMPGDDEVKHPMYRTTRAITIKARPAEIWPWLVQMGYRRGGLYSYDWLDRLFGILDRPSAESIIPEFQNLKVGDVIPLGAGPNWPVKAIESNRSLLIALHDPQNPEFALTWSWGIYPLDETHTRLVSRVRGRLASTLGGFLMLIILDPTAFLMERKMLLGIKRRAERRSETSPEPDEEAAAGQAQQNKLAAESRKVF